MRPIGGPSKDHNLVVVDAFTANALKAVFESLSGIRVPANALINIDLVTGTAGMGRKDRYTIVAGPGQSIPASTTPSTSEVN